MNYLRVFKCWMYIWGGSFGSFGSAVDKKNEKWSIWTLSVVRIYVVARLVRLARQWANEPNEPARLEMCVSGPAFCSLAQERNITLANYHCNWVLGRVYIWMVSLVTLKLQQLVYHATWGNKQTSEAERCEHAHDKIYSYFGLKSPL